MKQTNQSRPPLGSDRGGHEVTPGFRRTAESRHRVNDRELIIEVTTRVAWYADQRRWDEIPNLFAARVLLDYTRLTGGEPTTVEPSQIVQSWRASLGGLDATQHMVTNRLVDLSEDEARAADLYIMEATYRD